MSIDNDVPQNEDEANQMLESLEQPTQETVEEAPVATQEFAFTVGGKELKFDLNKDRDKLIRYAQQGYDAPNRIGELTKKTQTYEQQLNEWKAKEARIKEYETKYAPVDEYIQKNPQWWSAVQAELQKAQNPNQGPVDPRFDSLLKEVDGLKQIAQTYQQRVTEQQIQQEDAKYLEDFTAIQKQYPKIDFSTPDEMGKTLEYKVLEYAQANGIKKFTTAFRDYHHDELVKIAAEEAKEKLVNDKVSKTKLGILGISPTPTPRKTESVKGKSYNDIEASILQEYGLT